MKNTFLILLCTLSLLLLYSGITYADGLWDSFVNPGHEARTKVWWFHGETETTGEGIEADLQAFSEAGVGGVVFYDQVHGSQDGACASMSPQWWDMLKFAALKARELGLSFDVASTNGYVAGGPWISPEQGMKRVFVIRQGEQKPKGFKPLLHFNVPGSGCTDFIDTLLLTDRVTVTDNKSVILTFDLNEPRQVRTISYTVRPRGKGAYGSMNIPGAPQKDYFGAMYILFPPIGELEMSDDGVNWSTVTKLRGIEDIIGYKSRQRTINFPPVTARYFRINIHDWQGESPRHNNLYIEGVRLMSYDMIDNWETKSGLRSELLSDTSGGYDDRVRPFEGEVTIGYAPTGGHTKHGRSKIVWQGQELSGNRWLEADVLSAEAARIHYNSYFKAVLDTMISIGCRPEGMQMDSHEAGIANWTENMPDHFLRLRGYNISPWIPALGGYIVESREATEKFLSDFKQTISDVVREQFYATFDSLCQRDGVVFTSQAMLGCANDNIASRGVVAKPQGEFWAYQKDGNYDTLDAASSAHLYGKRIASAEAFTDAPYFVASGTTDTGWKERGWHELLRVANLAYCKGINEFVVCASSYQPWSDRKYDDDSSAHPYIFHRHNPAWDVSREHFWDYQARCSQLLQSGKPVVDILVYLGQELPTKTMAFRLPEIPKGYCFDVASPASLRYWMSNSNDYTPEYKAVIVGDRAVISSDDELMLALLEQRGIIVVRCDRGDSPAQRLKESGLTPDMKLTSDRIPEGKVHFCHRVTDDTDIYFVYNHSASPFTAPISLRTSRNNIELWNPLTLQRDTPVDSMMILAPYESIFIIAR